MNTTRITSSPSLNPRLPHWQRLAVIWGLSIVGVLIAALILFKTFYRHVPPGHLMVVISKNGEPLPEGEVLAQEGQKGILREVRGEGYHFVWPVIYTTEVHPITVIEPGKVGIVTNLGGQPPRSGGVIAENDDERGIRRHVLPPGSYRLHPYGYKVEQVDFVRIDPGFVGVKRRLLGKNGPTKFATDDTMKGIIKDEILQPGIYYINTKEYQVLACEVGIYQTTYTYSRDKAKNTAITFPSRKGITIQLDCTIEWELKPEHWPQWLAQFGTLKTIEKIVIDQHVRKICRDRGFNYGPEDFLDGTKRETFQEDFRLQLDESCEPDKVVVRSAFIRNIIIPEQFLSSKRDRQLEVEKGLTADQLTETAESDNEVEEARKTIDLKVAQVNAETARKVSKIDVDVENLKKLTDAEIDKLQATYGAKIATLDAERKQVLGKAEAEASEAKETAKSALFEMTMKAFKNDGDAYLRYKMAQGLNPKLQLRLFQSGPGTLWTNMGDKKMNFMMPLATEQKKEKKAE